MQAAGGVGTRWDSTPSCSASTAATKTTSLRRGSITPATQLQLSKRYSQHRPLTSTVTHKALQVTATARNAATAPASEPNHLIETPTPSQAASTSGSYSQTDIEALRDELATLKDVVSSQSDILKQQKDTISNLSFILEKSLQLPQTQSRWDPSVSPLLAQTRAYTDRRSLGLYDARFHSASSGATPKDYRILPKRIILVRHAESEGNIDNFAYTYVPDPQVPLTEYGQEQALLAGAKIRSVMEADGTDYNLYFYTSPYRRSKQTYESLVKAFRPEQIKGVQEEVQLREQDFGNFQDVEGKKKEKAERLRFGRFFYRFPNGESGADVYDRMTIFEDHLVRDINAGRFADDTSLVLVTHGLALRVFLMRWFHWTVDQFMRVFNPPNAEPLVLERVLNDNDTESGPACWVHTKALYRLSDESRLVIKGCSEDMCTTSLFPRGSRELAGQPLSSGVLASLPDDAF